MGDQLPVIDFGAGHTMEDSSAGQQHTGARLLDGSLRCCGRVSNPVKEPGQLGAAHVMDLLQHVHFPIVKVTFLRGLKTKLPFPPGKVTILLWFCCLPTKTVSPIKVVPIPTEVQVEPRRSSGHFKG